MKEFKGSPTPWSVEKIKDSDGEISEIYILEPSNGCIICVNNGDDAYDIPTDLANAHLIAAAPDLLEAAINMVELFEMVIKQFPPMKNESAYINMKSAISKALTV